MNEQEREQLIEAVQAGTEADWLHHLMAVAWDQGWAAAQEVVELEGEKCWAHTVFPEGYEGNPYRS